METASSQSGKGSPSPSPLEASARAGATREEHSGGELYGTFFLADGEFAIKVRDIREVVHLPEQLTRVPLTPEYVQGIFNLRGSIVPVLDLKRILSLPDAGLEDQRVAILRCGGAYVGVVLDSTGEVIRIPASAVAGVQHRPGDRNVVVSGIAKLDDGARILQVLDADLIVAVDEVPVVSDGEQDAGGVQRTATQVEEPTEKVISFFCDGVEFAIDVERIVEIQEYTKLTNTQVNYEGCLGVVNLRGRLVSVLDFRQAMGGGASELNSDRRLIILRVDDVYCGLLVDGISEVIAYRPREVVPIPALRDHHLRDCFRGVIPQPGGRNVLSLDIAKLLHARDIAGMLAGNKSMSAGKNGGATAETTDDDEAFAEETFITFKLGSTLALGIETIREIIEYPDDVISPPGYRSHIRGMLNLRGTIIPILDLRKYYKMEPFADFRKTRVMIVDHEGQPYGLMVDSVEDIVKVRTGKSLGIPSVLRDKAGTDFDGNILTAFETKANGNGRKDVALVLDLQALLRGLAGLGKGNGSASTTRRPPTDALPPALPAAP